MRESPYLPPQTPRTVTQWAQYFQADPRDVAAAAARLGWNLGSAAPTTVTKIVFMTEVLPAPVIDYVRPRTPQQASVQTGRVLLTIHGRGFTEASQIILDANAPVDPDDPASGPQLAAETQVLTSGELVCVLPANAAGSYMVAVRTPYRKDSNHVAVLVALTGAAEEEEDEEPPPGVTLPEESGRPAPLRRPGQLFP